MGMISPFSLLRTSKFWVQLQVQTEDSGVSRADDSRSLHRSLESRLPTSLCPESLLRSPLHPLPYPDGSFRQAGSLRLLGESLGSQSILGVL